MKKLFISILIILMAVGVNAQDRDIQRALKDLAKAKELVAKKGNKAESWLKLADAYRNCYEAPINGLAIGTPKMQANLILKDQVPAIKMIDIAGQQFTVEEYQNKVIYYDATETIRAIKVVKPVLSDEDALEKAKEYYIKAKEMNISAKDLKQSVQYLRNDYWDMGMTGNTLSIYEDAAKGFEECYRASILMGELDKDALYYATIMSTLAKQSDKSIELANECLKNGYEDGNLYAMLAENYKAKGNLDKAKEYLEAGFAKFPTSQEILVSLINTYLDAKESPDKVFEFLHAAQKNEPANASLYYSEGNLYRELKEYDKAVEMFQKSAEVDPTYFYAPYSIGDLYYSMALDIQEKAASELDDAKYNKMNEQLTECLRKAIEPFTKAFEIAQEAELKSVCAEYLRNIYFRFKEENPAYAAEYEKYAKFAQEGAE